MLVTLWVFIGIEGASVYSARAARRADVGRATVIGFLGALGIYVLVTLIANGILIQSELAGLKVPSMAGVFESIVGPWGAALINIGLVVSVGGAFLSWTLLCAEIPYTCGKDGTFPKWFAGENANGSPVELALGHQRADPVLPSADLLLRRAPTSSSTSSPQLRFCRPTSSRAPMPSSWRSAARGTALRTARATGTF